MALLIFLPFIFGYFIAVRYFKESFAFNLTLSVPLGCIISILLLRILLIFLTFRQACWITVILMLIFLLLSVRSNAGPAAKEQDAKKNPYISYCLSICAVLIFFYTILSLLMCRDDDAIIHFPNFALLAKDYFPLINPFFPEFTLNGHYGRDLFISFLSIISGIDPLSMVLITAPFIQVSTFLLIFFLVKKIDKNNVVAFCAAFFVFFGVNTGYKDIRIVSGLFELVTNNNPVVYSGFFLILYAIFKALDSNDYKLVVFAGASLGIYDIIYESHFAALMGSTILITAFIPFVKIDKKAKKVKNLLFIISIALTVSFICGGHTLSAASGSLLNIGKSSHPGDKAMELATQKMSISFPKRPLLSITNSANGKELFIFGKEFLSQQSFVLWLLPVSLLIYLIKRDIIYSLAGGAGILFILIPALIDFGRFNVESLRFVAGAGITAALAFGVLTGRLIKRYKLRVAAVFLILACFYFSPAIKSMFNITKLALTNTNYFYITPEDIMLAQSNQSFGNIDMNASKWLKSHTKKGDIYMANISYDSNDEMRDMKVAVSLSYITGIAGIPSRQMGLVNEIKGWTLQKGKYTVGYSENAKNFWRTLDPDIIRPLGINWLYVIKENLDGRLYQKLANDKRFVLMHSEKGAGSSEERDLYYIRY